MIQSLEALSLKFHTSHVRAEQELTGDANKSFRVMYMFNAFIASGKWCWVSTVCLLCGSYFLVEVQRNLGFEARYETNNVHGLIAHTLNSAISHSMHCVWKLRSCLHQDGNQLGDFPNS